MTIGCVLCRGPREDCYELHMYRCGWSAAYSRFALLPMYSPLSWSFFDGVLPSAVIARTPSRCVYMHSPLPNKQYFHHYAYAKNSKCDKDFIPDLQSTLSASSKERWHWFWTEEQPFDRIWQWRQGFIEKNRIFEYDWYLQLAETLKYILKDICICPIKQPGSDKRKRTWRG